MKSILKLQQDCIKIDIYVYAGIESNQLHICIYNGNKSKQDKVYNGPRDILLNEK